MTDVTNTVSYILPLACIMVQGSDVSTVTKLLIAVI